MRPGSVSVTPGSDGQRAAAAQARRVRSWAQQASELVTDMAMGAVGLP
jgi:hypothetical protein